MDLLTDVPDLLSFDYKKWDDDVRAKIESLLNHYRSPGSAKAVVTGSAPAAPRVEKAPAAAANESTTDTTDLNDFLEGLDL
jgi:hypothetical protein